MARTRLRRQRMRHSVCALYFLFGCIRYGRHGRIWRLWLIIIILIITIRKSSSPIHSMILLDEKKISQWPSHTLADPSGRKSSHKSLNWPKLRHLIEFVGRLPYNNRRSLNSGRVFWDVSHFKFCFFFHSGHNRKLSTSKPTNLPQLMAEVACLCHWW